MPSSEPPPTSPDHPITVTLVADLHDAPLELFPIVNYWLADLLRRYKLKKKPGMSPATGYEQKILDLVKVLDVLPDARSKLLNLTSQRLQLSAMIERFDFIN